MKKQLVIGIFLTLVLATISLMSNTTVVAHTEEDPLVVTLYAGQDIGVGEVHVWNDEDNIHVEYVITNTEHPWVITETHLYIGKNVPPVSTPGQFPYYEDPADDNSYEIPLDEIYAWKLELNNQGKPTGKLIVDGAIPAGVDSDDTVYIAAHAVVEYEIVTHECINLVSDETVQWLGLDGTTWTNAVLCFEHGSWPKISGVNYIWRTALTDVVYEYNNVPTYDSGKYGWLFKKDFSLPSSAYNIVGSIDVNVDNSYEFSLNSALVGAQGTMNRDGPDSYEWNDIRNYAINPIPGVNTLSFRVLNYFNWGDSYGNPAGLTFKASICYDYISEYQEETAWGDGTNFGTNWAEYFTYDIQGWVLLDTLIVNSEGWLGDHDDTSNFNSEVGKTYLFKASGTYIYCTWDGRWADSEFVWRTTYWEDDALHFVCLNDESLNLGDTYNPEHIYYAYFIGDGNPITFEIRDENYPAAWNDNVGHLTLEIYGWA